MPITTTPVQIIQGSLSLFVYTWFLGDAIGAGRITSTTFKNHIRLGKAGKGVVNFRFNYSASGLKAETNTLIRITLGTTAISTNKALEVVYGEEFNAADTSPAGSARALL